MWKLSLTIVFLLSIGGCSFVMYENAQLTKNTITSSLPANEAVVEWKEIKPGLEQKTTAIDYENHQYVALVFRLDNKMTQWDLAYNQDAKRLSQWAEDLDSDLVINGAFFTEDYIPTGLFRDENVVIADSPYTESTIGTVAIKNGRLSLGKDGKDVFQSFPLLVRPDKNEAVKEDTEKIARRTILAQDNGTYSYIIIFDTTPISLFDASIVVPRLLPDLVWALNLDGGPSTGVIVRDEEDALSVLPAAVLPIVLSAKTVAAASPHGQ